MKVIKPSYEIVNEPNWDEVIIGLEKAIRTCYKSERVINATSADKLIRSIIERGHESTLEHHSMTVRFVCDRGVSHEMVWHRHCSFSQESTRYVGYAPECKNYQGDMQFILPCWVDDSWVGEYDLMENTGDLDVCDPEAFHWMASCMSSQKYYNFLITSGWKPEQARSVLPNSLKTEVVVTTNMRDWRHIFHLRCDKTAHPQMRELMLPLYMELADKCPALFDTVDFDVHEDQKEEWFTGKGVVR